MKTFKNTEINNKTLQLYKFCIATAEVKLE